MKFVCVLRSGGDYDLRYVEHLKASFYDNINHPAFFHALTDLGELTTGYRGLEHNWPGWWSKIEIFRIPGPVIYMDLETIICGDLSPLADHIEKNPGHFVSLRSFRDELLASGVMAWGKDCNVAHIYDDFRPGYLRRFVGDQDYIRTKIEPDAFLQDILPGVYSYKHHCRQAIPKDARLICFHGKPRPHEVNWLEGDL